MIIDEIDARGIKIFRILGVMLNLVIDLKTYIMLPGGSVNNQNIPYFQNIVNAL